MCLAAFVKNNEDALICDLAETYQIYDWKSYHVSFIAILAAGLRQNSRSRMALDSVQADLNGSLLAIIHDDLQNLIYVTQSAHSRKKLKKPEYITDKIIHGVHKQATEYQGYESSEDYEKAWERLAGHKHIETR